MNCELRWRKRSQDLEFCMKWTKRTHNVKVMSVHVSSDKPIRRFPLFQTRVMLKTAGCIPFWPISDDRTWIWKELLSNLSKSGSFYKRDIKYTSHYNIWDWTFVWNISHLTENKFSITLLVSICVKLLVATNDMKFEPGLHDVRPSTALFWEDYRGELETVFFFLVSTRYTRTDGSLTSYHKITLLLVQHDKKFVLYRHLNQI